MARILANDRVLLTASSGFGKSTLAAYLFHEMTAGGCQNVMIDPKAEWIIPGAAVCRVPEQLAEAIEKQVRIHYVPSTSDRAEWDAVYDVLSPTAGRRDVVVWTDEAQNVCVSGANWAPRGMKLIQTQGRFAGIGHLYCATRPIDIETTLRSEAIHIFVFAGGLDYDDLAVLAKQMRAARDERGRPLIGSADDLQAALAQLPDYGYLWFDRRLKKLQPCPPLPDDYRRVAARTARQRP